MLYHHPNNALALRGRRRGVCSRGAFACRHTPVTSLQTMLRAPNFCSSQNVIMREIALKIVMYDRNVTSTCQLDYSNPQSTLWNVAQYMHAVNASKLKRFQSSGCIAGASTAPSTITDTEPAFAHSLLCAITAPGCSSHIQSSRHIHDIENTSTSSSCCSISIAQQVWRTAMKFMNTQLLAARLAASPCRRGLDVCHPLHVFLPLPEVGRALLLPVDQEPNEASASNEQHRANNNQGNGPLGHRLRNLV
ncbi:hypothetical protein COO60DRAFT_658320 [Scenedesmus sp. NREL 46B-D3]|nr:hypothetical protein COO60DRAFT_658320 [Scenedesmus sp. NREL 46B-D3]